jgi:hypothetical protein
MIFLPLLAAVAVMILALVVFQRKKMVRATQKAAGQKTALEASNPPRKRGRGSVPPPPPPPPPPLPSQRPPRPPRNTRAGFKRDTAMSVDDVYLEDAKGYDEEGIDASITSGYDDGNFSESGISYPWDDGHSFLGMETSYADAMTVAELSIDEEPTCSSSSANNNSGADGAETISSWRGADGSASVWSVPVGVHNNFHDFDDEETSNSPSIYWL